MEMSSLDLQERWQKGRKMGSRFIYTCSCGYEKKVDVGAGLMGVNRKMIARFFPADILAQFEKEQQAGNVESYLLENALVCCPACKKLQTVPYFHYESYGHPVKEYFAHCKTCGGKVTFRRTTDNVTCPKCGQKMKCVDAGIWD